MAEFEGEKDVSAPLKSITQPILQESSLQPPPAQSLATAPPPPPPPEPPTPEGEPLPTFRDQFRDKENRPLVYALVAVLAGLLCLAIFRNAEIAKILAIMLVTNSAAQMAIDFYKKDNKPYFSALARLVPIVATILALWARG